MTKFSFNKCLNCGQTLNRFKPGTIIKTVNLLSGFNTHKCTNCDATYGPSSLIIILILMGLYFIPIEYTSNNILIHLLSVLLFILYLLFLSPLTITSKHNS